MLIVFSSILPRAADLDPTDAASWKEQRKLVEESM